MAEAAHSKCMIWAQALNQVRNLRVPLPEKNITHAFYKFYAYLDVAGDPEPLRAEILARAAKAGLRLFSGTCSEMYLGGSIF
jgi:hypothetical protein